MPRSTLHVGISFVIVMLVYWNMLIALTVFVYNLYKKNQKRKCRYYRELIGLVTAFVIMIIMFK